jgi:inner membrane transporter RhtA
LPIALAVAVLSSALPYTLEMYALTRLPNQVFSLFMSVEPALAALMGALVLHEQLTALQLLAIGCVMAASFGSAWSSRKGKPS